METDKKQYGKQFYIDNKTERKTKSVDFVLAEAIKVLPDIRSAVDFGCGTGTWLAALKKYDVTDIKGLDGSWVKKEALVIPEECFVEADFDKEIRLDKKYDLAITIDVGEHLLEKSARGFVKALTDASDIILFSSAIPFQGGTNHVNEQWPAYWNKLFNENDYIAVDCLRKRFWNNMDILGFHRQNIMIYVRRSKQQEIKAEEGDFCIDRAPMPIIDHVRYLNMIKNDLSRMSLFQIIINANKWFIIQLFGKEKCKRIYYKYINPNVRQTY
jgi:SAM-dependent methyltransferase